MKIQDSCPRCGASLPSDFDETFPRSIRFTNAEVCELRKAGLRIGIGWTTFVRRAVMAVTRRLDLTQVSLQTLDEVLLLGNDGMGDLVQELDHKDRVHSGNTRLGP